MPVLVSAVNNKHGPYFAAAALENTLRKLQRRSHGYGLHCLRTIWVLHQFSYVKIVLFSRNRTKFAARPESRQPAGVCDQLLVGEIVRLTACLGHCFSLHSAKLQLHCCDFDDDVSLLMRIKCIPIEDWGHLKETWSTTATLLVFLIHQSDTFSLCFFFFSQHLCSKMLLDFKFWSNLNL